MSENKTQIVEQAVIDKCLVETYKHIKRVGHFLAQFSKELINRAEVHDNSKLEEPELSGFAANTERLSKVEYGSQEYKEMLTELQPTIQHHYSRNRHHTEHWPNGINDMNLVDILEMLADWRAATERNKNGNIRQSVEFNSVKYSISPQLKKILENTVRDYFQD
jgi:hypothetical protein